MGYLSVSVFFFMNGFGLMQRYMEQGAGYLEGFPRKRIVPFYCKYIFLVWLYFLINIFLGSTPSISVMAKSMAGVAVTVVDNGWYMQVLLLFYIAYWCIFKVCSRNSGKLGGIFVFLACYCVYCSMMQYSTTRYEAVFAFLLGFLWCLYKSKIDKVLYSHYTGCLLVVFLGFCICYILGNTSIFGFRSVPFKAASSVIFAAMVICLIVKVPVRNFITRNLGRLFFELYVMQGIPMRVFHSDVIYIENDWIYILLCLSVTAVLAVVMHPVFQFVDRTVKVR